MLAGHTCPLLPATVHVLALLFGDRRPSALAAAVAAGAVLSPAKLLGDRQEPALASTVQVSTRWVLT